MTKLSLSLSSRHRPGDSFEIKAAIHRTILLFVLRKWKCSLDVLFDGRTPEISLLIRMVKNEFDNWNGDDTHVGLDLLDKLDGTIFFFQCRYDWSKHHCGMYYWQTQTHDQEEVEARWWTNRSVSLTTNKSTNFKKYVRNKSCSCVDEGRVERIIIPAAVLFPIWECIINMGLELPGAVTSDEG